MSETMIEFIDGEATLEIEFGEDPERIVVFLGGPSDEEPEPEIESTDDLPEGEENLYYTDDRVDSRIESAIDPIQTSISDIEENVEDISTTIGAISDTVDEQSGNISNLIDVVDSTNYLGNVIWLNQNDAPVDFNDITTPGMYIVGGGFLNGAVPDPNTFNVPGNSGLIELTVWITNHPSGSFIVNQKFESINNAAFRGKRRRYDGSWSQWALFDDSYIPNIYDIGGVSNQAKYLVGQDVPGMMNYLQAKKRSKFYDYEISNRYEPIPSTDLNGNWSVTSGQFPMMCFTPNENIQVNRIYTMPWGDSSHTNATLCKVGLFQVHGWSEWEVINATCVARSDHKADRWNNSERIDSAPIYDNGAASPSLIDSIILLKDVEYAAFGTSIGHTGTPKLASAAFYRPKFTRPHVAYFGGDGFTEVPSTLTSGWVEAWNHIWFGLGYES